MQPWIQMEVSHLLKGRLREERLVGILELPRAVLSLVGFQIQVLSE